MRGVSGVRKRTKAKKEGWCKVLQKHKCIFYAQNTFGQTKGMGDNNEQRRTKSYFPLIPTSVG